MKSPELLKSESPSVVETLRSRLRELKHDRDTVHAQLKTFEQERYDLQQLKAELYQSLEQEKCLLTKLQKVREERDDTKARLKTVEQERDDTKARLKTVEKERDDANGRVRLAIAEWYRLEMAAYGAPDLGGI